MSAPKLRVAICGGGIGGLCLAVALSKYTHIQVDVYESAGRFKEIGAGVMIWERTWHILELLGLATDLARVADGAQDPSAGWKYRRSDTVGGFQWAFISMPHGLVRFHRSDFLDVFVGHVPEGVAHFGKRLLSYNKRDGGELGLEFEDGTSAMLRAKAQELGRPDLLALIEPKWTGTIAYRGLIPATELPTADGAKHRTLTYPMMYCGQSKHIVAYSVSRGHTINVVAFASELDKDNTPYSSEWVTDCTKDEMLQCFAGWEPEVTMLLERVDKPTKWGIHHLHPLPFFVADRVALLGDAAHGMSPHLGAGAGQAIEDAYILASILGSGAVTSAALDAALGAYQQTRLRVANRALENSYEAGKMFEFNSSLGDEYSILGPAMGRQWAFLTESTPEGETEKAMGIFWSLQGQ